MKIFLQGADTQRIDLDRWVVLNEDGGIIGVIHEPTLDNSSDMMLTMQNGEQHKIPTAEAGDFEMYRGIISSALGTDDYDLVVMPIPPSAWFR